MTSFSVVMMARLRRPTAWLVVAAVLFAAFGSREGFVLCFGEDGHVAVEAAREPCAAGAPAAGKSIGAFAAWSKVAKHGPCLDVAVATSLFGERDGAAIQSNVLEVSIASLNIPVAAPPWPSADATGRISIEQFCLRSPVEWRRSVVLLI